MKTTLRVLIVEDEIDTVQLLVHLLAKSRSKVFHRHVSTGPEYLKALSDEAWHVVLCDYVLPEFGAPEALKLLQQSGLDIPFIVVSGRIGEETAAEMMRAGADDFVNKTNLARIVPSVQRAVAEAGERRQRRAAEALRLKISKNLRNIVRENVDGMIVLSESGSVLYANPAMEAFLGRRQVEFLGKEFGTPVSDKRTVEIQLLRKDGQFAYVEMRNSATDWEGEPATLLTMRDVTEHKSREERLCRLNRALTILSQCNRTLVRAKERDELLDGVCKIVVEEGGFRFAWVGLLTSTQGERCLRPTAWAGSEDGYLEALGTRWVDRAGDTCPIGEAVRMIKPLVIQDISSGTSVERWRKVALQRNYRSVAALPMVFNDEVLGSLNIYSDKEGVFSEEEIALLNEMASDLAYGITALRRESERKAAEAAVHASEERFRLALTHAPLPTMVHAEDGEVITINDAWTRVTGYTHEDIPTVGTWFAKAYGEKAAEVSRVMKELYKDYVPRVTGEFTVRTHSGEERLLHFTTAPLGRLPDGRRGIIGMAVDLTEERATQAKLRHVEEQNLQLQKMESVGRLAGGIAHDFNNVLHAIGGYTEFALSELKKGTRLYQDIQAVRKLLNRASSLTQQLLAFSRRQTLQFEVLDLNEQIEESIKLLRRLIGEDVEVVFKPAGDLNTIYADQGQLYQVIMNLAVNARDAMPNGGTLTIETGNKEFDDAYCAEHFGGKPGGYVLLAISDTGTGMDKETSEKIFEPFFTTKSPGHGTGLGLSTVYGIVKQHGGNIWVYSEPGLGTTFKIYLPRTEKQAFSHDAPVDARTTDGEGETILIAEDEEHLRFVFTRILEAHGYKVVTAETTDETIALGKSHAGELRLLLTDVVMPGMSGPDLHRELQKHIPKLPVLFMSGYMDDTVFKHGILEKGTPFIQKPFSSTNLLATVKKVLNGAYSPNDLG